MRSDPGTYTRLQTLVFDSLIEGLRGSLTETPSTLKLYRYAPESIGPSVTSQIPLGSFFISAPWPRPGMSPALSRTDSAFGARMRNVPRRSAATSGETTCGPRGAVVRGRSDAGCADAVEMRPNAASPMTA